MRRPLLCSLILATALFTGACTDDSPWYAEATEWLTGLPMDNMCVLTAPVWVVPAESGKDSPFKIPSGDSAHQHLAVGFDYSDLARTRGELPALPMLPTKQRAYLMLYSAPANDAGSRAIPLPQGARIELLSAWIEKMNGPSKATPLYAVCAALYAPEEDLTFWAVLAWDTKPAVLPLLADPATGKPLRMDMEDASEYTHRRSFTR